MLVPSYVKRKMTSRYFIAFDPFDEEGREDETNTNVEGRELETKPNVTEFKILL